jgi:hypothetical protein
VLDRGNGIDRVLGAVLRDFPTMSIDEAIGAFRKQLSRSSSRITSAGLIRKLDAAL